MIETHLPENGFDRPADSRGLHRLEWSALCARLDAARELRRAMPRTLLRAGVPSGNFSCFSKQPGQTLKKSEPRVNREALADIKCNAATMPDMANEHISGDRDTL